MHACVVPSLDGGVRGPRTPRYRRGRGWEEEEGSGLGRRRAPRPGGQPRPTSPAGAEKLGWRVLADVR